MIYGKHLRIPIAGALIGIVAACSGQPYVHVASEFNRESDVFLHGITERSSVTICYAKRASQSAEVARLANEECGRFGKRAIFNTRSLQECPLVTPVAAIYRCLAPGERVSDLNR